MKHLIVVFTIIAFNPTRIPIASCLLHYETKGMKPMKAAKLCYRINKPLIRKVTKL